MEYDDRKKKRMSTWLEKRERNEWETPKLVLILDYLTLKSRKYLARIEKRHELSDCLTDGINSREIFLNENDIELSFIN